MNQESDQEKYYELTYYTLNHGDPTFIHQHIVDVFIAQHVSDETKPISLAFSLIGLCLYLEKGYTGREVQLAHMQLAKHKTDWVKFDTPDFMGTISVADVLAAEAGDKRDDMIHKWCQSVWDAWKANHQQVRDLVKTHLT